MWAGAGALGGTELDQRAHKRWGFRAGPTLGPQHQARWSRWSRAGSHPPPVCLIAQVPQDSQPPDTRGRKNSSPFTEQAAEAPGGKCRVQGHTSGSTASFLIPFWEKEEGGWQTGRLTEEIPQEQKGHNTRLRIPDSHQEKELGVGRE